MTIIIITVMIITVFWGEVVYVFMFLFLVEGLSCFVMLKVRPNNEVEAPVVRISNNDREIQVDLIRKKEEKGDPGRFLKQKKRKIR